MSQPSPRMPIKERVALLSKCLTSNVSFSLLSKIFEAEEDDLRMFIKLNAPELSAKFETIVQDSKVKVERRPTNSGRQVRRNLASPTAPTHRAAGGSLREQRLVELILGGIRFTEEERPFNRLREDDQDMIRNRAESFVEWREQEQIRPRARF